eukprot:TRINITY_DN5364_c0_g2_i3.p1 TRINITY_DN5364_c0_g2~~TRINITY_DN5364_c0_g2_i3.p1  ORF type:complete len:125 (-),score=4.77 TRINITY_DN5364_c0_g2_i3:43-417(-)
MHLVASNIKGLNDPTKQHHIRQFILSQNISVIVILETKIQGPRVEFIANHCMPNSFWNYTHNFSCSSNGRILLLWNTKIVQLVVKFSLPQVIHTLIQFNGKIFFALLFMLLIPRKREPHFDMIL